MNKVQYTVVYPKVERKFPDPSDPERQFSGEANIGCDTWKSSAAMRHGFCEMIFAGAGNHPGIHDGEIGMPFDSGDPGVNRVHGYWASARVRSMSVGDLINIDPKGLNEWWLCDSCGFVILSEDEVVSWLDFPREYGCSFIEVRKWKEANNLPVD